MDALVNKYRLSSYTISVDLENTENKVMMVHGYTGAIDISNKTIVLFLKSNKFFSKENVPFSDKTWDRLLSRGYITTKTKEEEQAYVARMADTYHRHNKLFSSFVFIPSYNCNFRCPYCTETKISKMGEQWSKRTFTEKMVDKAFKAMDEIAPYMQFNLKEIILFGGEPLLKENRDIVKYIVEKGHSSGYKFKAITNGYDLEHFKELLSENLIHTLQITVDGTKKWHDQRRVHFRDGGTFDKIIENIEMALETGVKVAIRVNTDQNNFDSIAELKKIFDRLGYYKYEKSFSVHVGWLYNNQDENTVLDKGVKFFKFKDLNQKLADKKIDVCGPSDFLYNNLYNAIFNNRLLSLSAVDCASQSGAYVFDPIGNIYNCLEIVGDVKYVLGNYANIGTIRWNESEISKWHDVNISTLKKCNVCKYAFLCHGGCPLKKIQNEGYAQTCENFPNMFKIAVNKVYNSYLQSKL